MPAGPMNKIKQLNVADISWSLKSFTICLDWCLKTVSILQYIPTESAGNGGKLQEM